MKSMKFFVITSPGYIPGEAILIARALDNGVDRIHLRKPDATIEDYRSLLQEIPAPYHSRRNLPWVVCILIIAILNLILHLIAVWLLLPIAILHQPLRTVIPCMHHPCLRTALLFPALVIPWRRSVSIATSVPICFSVQSSTASPRRDTIPISRPYSCGHLASLTVVS